MEKGTLYIVATPIGNLEDMTFRAVRVLKDVDLIAAEDTRHSRKLLTHYAISTQLTSYFDHNKILKGAYILEKLKSGLSVALISDAGTPCISDPGYQLIRDAVAADIQVVPVPGPSAAIAALSASGLQTDSFVFEGFLPNKQGKRRSKLLSIKDEQRAVIFHESPKRLQAALADMVEVLGDREIVIAREMTKVYEEFVRGRASEIIKEFAGRNVKGEIVILVAPSPVQEPAPDITSMDLLKKYIVVENHTLKDAVKMVVADTGLPRSTVYRQAIHLVELKKVHAGDN